MATRSALSSLPARLRPTSAATAAGGWRRFLSDGPTKGRSKDTLKEEPQEEDKRRDDPTMMEGPPKALAGLNLLLENALSKRELEFERKMNEHRAYFELKKHDTEMKLLKNAADSKRLLLSFEHECRSRSSTMQNFMSLQNNKLSMLKNSEDLRIQQANISILKGISWFLVIMGGGTVTIYCRMKGIL